MIYDKEKIIVAEYEQNKNKYLSDIELERQQYYIYLSELKKKYPYRYSNKQSPNS